MVDGAGLWEYHYSLMLATLSSPITLLLVIFLWIVYARKCWIYVSVQLNNPEYMWLQIFNSLPSRNRFKAFLLVSVWLLLPVLLYATLVIILGIHEHRYLSTGVIFTALIALTVGTSLWHVDRLANPGGQMKRWMPTKIFSIPASSYVLLLLRFIASRQKLLWLSFKIVTCGLLWLIGLNNNQDYYELNTLYLFYSFGIMAQLVLVYRIRNFEEDQLSFYRNLPISSVRRFFSYARVYGIMLLPEFIIIILMAPTHLHARDGLAFGHE